MTKLTIIASVSGSYRRGGLDLSSGRAVIVDEADLTKGNLLSLDRDPRVTISEAKATDPSGLAAEKARIDGELATALKEAAMPLKVAQDALKAARTDGGAKKSDAQNKAFAKAKGDLDIAKSVHDDAVKEARTSADDERKRLGIKS